jgi:hypothetical protein
MQPRCNNIDPYELTIVIDKLSMFLDLPRSGCLIVLAAPRVTLLRVFASDFIENAFHY